MPRYITTMLKTGRYLALLAIAFLAVLSTPLGAPVPVGAHARLERSDPVSGSALTTLPGTVRLSFTEPVDPSSWTFRIYGPAQLDVAIDGVTHSSDRRTVELAIRPTRTPPGVYFLNWAVTSTTDGHDSSGTILFSVGTGRAPAAVATDQEPRSAIWQIALRAAWLAALGVIAGVAFSVTRRRSLILVTAGVAGMLAALASPAVSFSLSDLTRSGDYQLAAGAATLLAAGLAIPFRTGRGRWLAIVPWLAAIGLLSASGHAAGVAESAVAIAVTSAHVILTLAWFGWVVHVATRIAPDALDRLSRAATVGLVAIVATGIFTASLHLPDGRSITGSSYGRSLALKLGIVVLVLAIAGTNRWVVRPWMRSRGLVDRQSRALIAAEAAALALAILLGAVLSNTAPPADRGVVQVAAPIQRYVESRSSSDLTVQLSATLTGTVDDLFQISITDADGVPARDIERVIVETSATLPDGSFVSERFDAEPVADQPGVFRFESIRLGVSAIWEVRTTIRRSGVSDIVERFPVDTSAISAPAPRVVQREWRLPVVPPSAWALLAFATAVTVIGLFVLVRQRNVAPLSGALILIALAMITTGFTVQAYQRTVPKTAGHDLTKPGDPDLVSAAANYELLCLACHGPGGVGLDTIDPNHQHGGGTNLVDPLTRTRSDGDLYTILSTGVPGTDMPAYDVALTDQERWDLVGYLRQLPVDAEASGS